jgi:hypothetical protein
MGLSVHLPTILLTVLAMTPHSRNSYAEFPVVLTLRTLKLFILNRDISIISIVDIESGTGEATYRMGDALKVAARRTVPAAPVRTARRSLISLCGR